MNRLNIIEKIKCLLKLTTENGCTEGEAKAAYELAQKLIKKHNIKDYELQDNYSNSSSDDYSEFYYQEENSYDEELDEDETVEDDADDDDYYESFSQNLDDGYTDPDDIEAFFYGNDLYDCFDDLKTWEMHKCLDIFGLGEDYTLQELERAYHQKLKENNCEHITKKSSFITKDSYFHITAGYKYAQRHFREFKQCLAQRSEYSTYYKKKTKQPNSKSSNASKKNKSVVVDLSNFFKHYIIYRFARTKIFQEICLLLIIMLFTACVNFYDSIINPDNTPHNQVQMQYLRK